MDAPTMISLCREETRREKRELPQRRSERSPLPPHERDGPWPFGEASGRKRGAPALGRERESAGRSVTPDPPATI